MQLVLFSFAPTRIDDVTRDKNDPGHVAAEVVLSQVRANLPPPVAECINALLKSSAHLRPAARSFLGGTDTAGNHQDTYFSRAEMQLPVYWSDALPGRDENFIEVTDDHTMRALRHAVAPQAQADFGKGLDAGRHWPKSIPPGDRSIKGERR